MQPPVSVCRRMPALDDTSFRFERKAQTLYVNGLPAQVRTLPDGKGGLVVELVTEGKTVQVSGATYWNMVYDDLLPTPLLAGLLLANYEELVGRLQRLPMERSTLKRSLVSDG